jgi:hypothetical protein
MANTAYRELTCLLFYVSAISNIFFAGCYFHCLGHPFIRFANVDNVEKLQVYYEGTRSIVLSPGGLDQWSWYNREIGANPMQSRYCNW